MYEKIFGKVTVFFSREFLAKGLFPAAVPLLLGLIATLGWRATVAAAADTLRSPLTNMSALVAAVLVLLLVSVLFQVYAFSIFSFFDGTGLRKGLREYLRRRSSEQRRRLQAEVDEREARATLVNWMRLRNLADWPFAVPSETVIEVEKARDTMERASTVLSGLDKRNSELPQFKSVLDAWQVDLLAEGVGAITNLRFSASGASDALRIARAWARRLRKPHNIKLAEALERAIHLEWSYRQAALARKFPDQAQVQPTRLGNVIAALDDYGKSRYGVPTSVAWSRLWWLLTEGERTSVSSSKLSVDAGVNLTAGMLMSPLFIVIFWILMRPVRNAAPGAEAWPQWLTLTFIALGAALTARVSYLMTVSLVATLADKVTALLDVRRLQWLRQMGFDPRSLEAEQGVVKELWLFLIQGSPLGKNSAAVYAGVCDSETSTAPQAAGPVDTKDENMERIGEGDRREDDQAVDGFP